jgi:hypothetical protein
MIDTSNFDAQLQSIFDRYDPENDIAPGPAVTWADHHVAYSLVFVRRMLDDLQYQINELAQDPPNPNMGEYQKLLNRLSECESVDVKRELTDIEIEQLGAAEAENKGE